VAASTAPRGRRRPVSGTGPQTPQGGLVL